MTTSTRIAVLRISIAAVRETFEVADASEGWSAFAGADGARLEVSPRGSALLVRFEGPVGALSASFGELWALHEESRGVAVHEQAPEGDDYDSLIESATWEGGGLFAMAASALGGGKRASEPEVEAEVEAEGGEGEGDDAFDKVADKLMSAVAKRSSRKVLAARLAADKGEKDLGDVLDAMESAEAEGDDALLDEVDGRFGFDVEHQEMADLLARKLTGEEDEAEVESETESEPPANGAEE